MAHERRRINGSSIRDSGGTCHHVTALVKVIKCQIREDGMEMAPETTDGMSFRVIGCLVCVGLHS